MPGPAPLHITTRSGGVRVQAAGEAELSVVGGTIERREDGTLHIRRESSADSIEVRCAPGTDVTVGTVSGKVELLGGLGAVRVATVSGTVRVGGAARVDLRTKSGSIDVERCAGECRVMTTSANVHVEDAGRATVSAVSGDVRLQHVGGAEVKTVSGTVLLTTVTNAGPVSVHSVSGRVEVRVPAEVRPATRLRSVSGRVECDCPPGDDIDIAATSVSGAIRVTSD